jgi:uncharacterized protein YndB with AHSA1/START domain
MTPSDTAPSDTLGTTTFGAPSDVEITMTRTFDAPRRLVFAAFTDPEHLPHWLVGPEGWTMSTCEVDLRVGGGWHFAWRHVDGQSMEMRGEYLEVAAPERLVRTESWGGDWPETVCTLVLDEQDGRTTITDTIRYPSRQARDAATATGMSEGADRSFALLAALLATLPR